MLTLKCATTVLIHVLQLIFVAVSFPGRLQLVAAKRAEREVWHPDPPVTLAPAAEAGGAAGLPQEGNQERTQGKLLKINYCLQNY